MKTNLFKRVCALLLVMLTIFTLVPMDVFAQQIDENNAVVYSNEAVQNELQSDFVSVASAEELEQALKNKSEKICITADFFVDRTFYVDYNVSIFSNEAHTITRKADFAGDIFVVGEASDGTATESVVTLSVGKADSQANDMLIFDGNSTNMTVTVTGTVFFVCKMGKAELYPNLTVKNCKKQGNVRALEERHTLSNSPSNVGGAVGIVADTASMDIYGGKYLDNGVDTSGTYGGAFFNHGKMNVYGGEYKGGYAVRAGVFYNYRTMNIKNAAFTNNTASVGGAIYLPSSTGAILTLGDSEQSEIYSVTFENNTAETGGALANSGSVTMYNTLFKANTSSKSAGAVYSSGKYNKLSIYNCDFTLNKAGVSGGAVYVTGQRTSSQVELDVRNSSFTFNEATENGGALCLTDSARGYVRDSVFSENKAGKNGGVVYTSSARFEANSTIFSKNTAGAKGGAVTLEENAQVVLNKITAENNEANTNGGFLYSGAGTLTAYDSLVKSNTADSGSAMYLYTSAVADIYNCRFENNICNETTTGNAGALMLYTGGTTVKIHDTAFTGNESSGFGGALLVSGKSVVELYNITAENNKALKGGFMYETVQGTVVTVSGLTVSGNTATKGGPIIWGNTTNAKLIIDKNAYTDKDITATLDDAYWSDAIYNDLTVEEKDITAPSYGIYEQPEYDTKGSPEVRTSKQLSDAISSGFEKIYILNSFEIDRTYFVANNVELICEGNITLTRKSGFAGDIFVIGQTKDGTVPEEKVTLTVGKQGKLTIDGNSANMGDTAVKGTVFFVCTNGNAELYENLTVKNCKKTANDRTLEEAHGLSYPKNVGGAVGIISNKATMNIYGGVYENNSANMNGNSNYGGAFFNFGTMKVYGGTFKGGSAERAGAFYNYRNLYIYKATIENNSAVTGGAIYLPSSTGALLYLGSEDAAIESQVTIKNNTATGNGGAIYLAGRMTAIDTIFTSNSAANGGAIYGGGNYKTITAKDVIFSKNTSTEKGGAVYLSGQSSYADKAELRLDGATFSQNGSKDGGAVYLTTSRAYITDSFFSGNTATSGGAIKLNASQLEAISTIFSSNTSTVNGGAIDVNEACVVSMNKITASKNTAGEKGGFIYGEKAEAKVYNSNFNENTASSGGAFSLGIGTKAEAYNCSFNRNKALTADGGAMDIYSGESTLLHTCKFIGNTAKNNGGAVKISGATDVKLYNTTATDNSASKGGFMHVDDAKTAVTVIGLTLSGNTATNGAIIWGNNSEAVININKSKITDKNHTGSYDEAYFKKAIANKIKINYITDEAPRYAEYGNEEPGGMWNATDVSSAAQLEAALKAGKAEIRITKSFELDRTFYVTKSTTIFSTVPVTLKRATAFGGDIFVIGQSADGKATDEKVVLSVGNPASATKNLLTFDGDKANVTAKVVGTVFFVCTKGHVKLYENVTVKNFKKTGNERTLDTVHGVSYPEYVGGAVGILANKATMDIYGGNYNSNQGNDSGKSIYGGAFYNFGTMNIYGGTFTSNRASRAGAIYNYRTLNIYKAEFKSNYATSNGGAIYMPSSTGAFLYIGRDYEGEKGAVSFISNSAAGNAGAIYATNLAEINNTLFEKNKGDNGGAIGSYSAVLTLEGCSFKSNTATVSGAAVFSSGRTSRSKGIELTVTNTAFESNTATKSGGALCLKSDARASLENSTFTSNTTKENGGAVALYNADAVIRSVTSQGDTADNMGGFLYANASTPRIYGGEFSACSAVNGGAVALEENSTSQIVSATFKNNTSTKGGALYSLGSNLLVHSSSLTENTAEKGGAIEISGGTAGIYNVTARKNTAQYGGVINLTGDGVSADVNGITLSENTASASGDVIYSDSKNGTLKINKSNLKDEAVTVDDAYWSKAVAGTLKITATTEKIPGYAEEGNESYGYLWDAKDASTVQELQKLLSAGEKYIRIVADIELDRTFEVKKSAVIFSTKAHKLTRKADFGGIIFNVTGSAVLTFGNSTSETKDLLTIDGNKDNMTAELTGSFAEIGEKASVQIYTNATFTCFGSPIFKIKGKAKILGGTFTSNVGTVMENEGTAEISGGAFTSNKSTQNAGVILNKGNLTVSGGEFTSNGAIDGGVIYNEGTVSIRGGAFSKNTATNGAVLYNKGTAEIINGEFISNTAKENGGVVSSEKSVSVSDGTFTSNKAKQGGAVYITSEIEGASALTITKAVFTSNTATNGGAISANASKLIVTASFNGNSATKGGAVYLTAGSDADLSSVTSDSDIAKEKGAFIYSDSSNVNLISCTVDSSSGTAVYMNTSGVLDVMSSAFKSCTTGENGGAITLTGEAVSGKIDKGSFTSCEATQNGGAIYTDGIADMSVTDSTFSSCKAKNGGAVYADGGAVTVSGTSFTSCEATKNGGALDLEGKAEVILNNITAKTNKSGENGGFMFTDNVKLTLENSKLSSNTASASGGAISAEGDSEINLVSTELTSNTAKKNGGALSLKTDSIPVTLNGCKLNSNSASQNGGAVYASGGCVAGIYNTTFTSNSAADGAVLYITSNSTEVTVNGITVSGNKASNQGNIIYGNSSRATLKINKSNYTDKNETGTLTSSYWSKAIMGSVRVKDIKFSVPEYSDSAVKVYNAKELEKAINSNKKYIRIEADFSIDRTFYITSDITIYSVAPRTLTRAENFGGDFFVVGENSKGERAYLDSPAQIRLTLGNPLSEEENLLTIDGNSANMKTQVNGSVMFICFGAKAEINPNVTIKNCFKQGNEQSYGELYRLSRPNRIGGSVAIIANGTLTVNGGNFLNNKVNLEDATTEEGRNSSIGGVFYNNGNLIIKDGNFIGNEGARGGIVYSYRIVKILGGTFRDNVATKFAAIYYAPSSPSVHLVIGNTEKDGKRVLIKNNVSQGNGGVIYSSHFSAVLIFGNTSFKNNKVLSGNGGVISAIGAVTVKNTEFIGNSSTGYGGAVQLSRTSSDEITRLMHFENCTFSDNTSKYGGAMSISSAAASAHSKGAIVTVENCVFKENYSSSNGGTIFADKLSDLTITNSTFESNRAKGEAGALYITGKSSVKSENNTFTGNEASTYGGAISIRSAHLSLKSDKLLNNKSKSNGGAMYIAYSSAQDINSHVTADNVSFKGNSASSGGAFYATRRSIEPDAVLINVKNSTFEENKSSGSAGAILLTASVKAYFKNVTFKSNTASTNGGAVYVGSNTLFEADKVTFKSNTANKGGALALYSGGTALMNSITASENKSTGNGGFLYSEGGVLKLYNSTLSKNSGYSGGAMYLYTGAVSDIYNTKLENNKTFLSSSGATGNGGALFIYTGDTQTLVHSSQLNSNETTGTGGAIYISGASKVKLYNNTASNNKAVKGGYMYVTKAGTVVDVVGLTVSGNSATEGGNIIWGNTGNAVLNLDKAKYKDSKVSKLDDAYWTTAIEGTLKVNNVTTAISKAESYTEKKEPTTTTVKKDPVSVEDVFALGKKSSDADINSNYNKLKKLDNSSNFMSRGTKDYKNINGKTVTVDTFVYPTKGKTDNGIVGLGILLYQCLLYKKANPNEEVTIDIASYRFSVQSAVNINRNSRYFGYMRNLENVNYDKYGFVRLSYLLITAAKMGIHVNVIGHQDAYPINKNEPNFHEYFTMQLGDPCDPKYAKGKLIGDYLDFNHTMWTLDSKGGTDMMHTKMATVSHYLDMNGKVHRNAVWSSSSNLDGVKADGQNANWKLQTALLITNHDDFFRITNNYLRLIASLTGQEEVIEFQTIVNQRSTDQIDLINAGRGDEIPKDEQLVYLGTSKDKVFELYFTPFGGNTIGWDEVYNPYCKYLREMYESEDYIIFAYNAAEYSGRFVFGQQMEKMIIDAFHKNRNVKNKIYSYMESFDPTTFDDLVVGKDIGYKSFFEKPFGKVHNKDMQMSYVKDGQRYFVTLHNSCNFHSGSMSYQSNFMIVVKEKNCKENGVFSTIARHSTTGDIAAHTYSELKTKAATKKEHGYTYVECIYCGDKVIKQENLHYEGEWVIDKKATTTKDGQRHKSCTVCNETIKKEAIPRNTISVDIGSISGKQFSSASGSPIKVSSTTLPLTIEARVQIPENITGEAGIIVGNYGVSKGNVISLAAVENGRVKLYISTSGKTFSHTFKKDIRSDEAVDVAITIASGKATLYVNGSKAETVKLSVTPKAPIKNLKIGGDNRKGNTKYFKGIIYSVNLFSKARTAEQIKKDRLLVSPVADNLIYTKYFDGYTVKKGAVTTTLTSKSFSTKKVYKLNKELSDTPKTIEATISLPKSVKGNGGVIFGNYNEKYKAPLNVEVESGGRIRLYFKNGSKTVSKVFKTDIRTNSGTVHIALTLSGKTAVLYVNGVKKETAKLSASIPKVTKNFCIGGDNRKGNTKYFKGKIYNVNLFSDVRTASEIKNDRVLVTSDASKLIYSAYVTSSSGDKVMLKAQSFTKDNKYTLNTLKSTPKTIEATIQLSKKTKKAAGVIFGNYDGNNGNFINLSVGENGKLKLSFKNGKTKVTQTFKSDVRSDSPVNIALTINGKKVALYLDAKKVQTVTLNTSLPKVTSGFVIGGDNRKNNTQYFKGKIYAVNLFSDIRTSSEIKKDMIVVTSSAKSLLYSGYFYTSACALTGVGKSHTAASSWSIAHKATKTECGVKVKKCTACGKVLECAEIRKTGK